MVRLLALTVLAATAVLSACGDDEGTGEVTSPAASEPALATGGDPTDGTIASEEFDIPVTLETGHGWTNPVDNPDFFVIERLRTAQAPFAYIAFMLPTQVYQPSETTLDLGDPPTDYVEWFNNHRIVNVVDSQDVTVGGLEGTQLELRTNTFSDFHVFKTSDGDYDLGFRDHVIMDVLEADGRQLLVTYGSDLDSNFDNVEP